MALIVCQMCSNNTLNHWVVPCNCHCCSFLRNMGGSTNTAFPYKQQKAGSREKWKGITAGVVQQHMNWPHPFKGSRADEWIQSTYRNIRYTHLTASLPGLSFGLRGLPIGLPLLPLTDELLLLWLPVGLTLLWLPVGLTLLWLPVGLTLL